MSGPFRTTFLMALIALGSSGIAAYYFPWPEVELVDAKVGQPIFETFADSKVRFVDIERFDDDQQTMQRISLQRKSGTDKWSLPGYANFNASNSALIAAVIGSVQDRKVLELVSNNQEDFAKFGVIDPSEDQVTPNKSYLGKKITLRDSNQETLASLIVGEAPQDTNKKGQAYVRISGQPNVYLLEFNPLVLTTKFSDWVDPNLLRLGPNEEQPTEITIDNFRISPETLATEPKRENFYRAQFVVVDGRLGVRSLEVEQANEWKKITPQPEQLRQIESGLGGIAALRFVKIRPKDKALANALLNPSEPATAEVLNANVDYGFRSGTNDLLPANMISTGGRIDVKTRNNVILRILFGNIETSVDTESKLCRLTAIIAVADLDSLPKPAPPTPADGEKLSEEEERQFARTLEEWNSQVTKAQNIANGYNQLHRQWFYAVDEGIVSALRPDLPDLNSNPEIDPAVAEPPKATEQQSTEQQSNEQQATENQATEKKTSEGDDGQEQDK